MRTFNPATLESQSSGFDPIAGNTSDVVGFQVWATWPGSVFRLRRQGLAVYPSWPGTNYMALVDKELPERAQGQLSGSHWGLGNKTTVYVVLPRDPDPGGPGSWR